MQPVTSLVTKAISEALNFGKTVCDNGWGMFTTFLKYKLEEMLGKILVKLGIKLYIENFMKKI